MSSLEHRACDSLAVFRWSPILLAYELLGYLVGLSLFSRPETLPCRPTRFSRL